MSLRFLMLAAGLALFFTLPATAQISYTVSGVHVDATAASSAEALNQAIAQGRPKAWTILYRRLTRQQDWARQPNLDAAALVRMSRGYNIANERRSTTRYVADVTYIFNPEAVNRTLQAAGIAYTQGTLKRILVVAMAPGFTTGAWAQALDAPQLRESVVPFTVAGLADAPGLSTLNFDNASWNDVAAAAGRIKATEAALVQLSISGGKATVNIRRLGQGEAPSKVSVEVPGPSATPNSYSAAAQAAMAAVQDMWKTRSAVDFSQRGKLTVIVRATDAEQWGAIRTALSGVDTVTGVDVTAMDIGYAQLSITYQGTTEQLRGAMAGAGLSLANRDGEWVLAMAP